MRRDLTRLDGPPQFGLEVKFVASAITHLAMVIGNRSVEAAHGAVQCCFSAPENRLGVAPVHRVPGHANCRFEKQVATVNQEWLLNCLLDRLSQITNFDIRIDAGHQHSKFISTEAPDDGPLPGAVLSKSAAQAVADRTQQFSASVIAHGLVDEAESFDVEEHNHRIARRILGPADQAL